MTQGAGDSTGEPMDALTAVRSGMLLALHARQQPDAPALTAEDGTHTFAQLNARANQLARALRSRGVKSGEAVALICANRREFAETQAAVQRSGLRLTPINWHLQQHEIQYILENCEARAVIADARFEASVGPAASGLDAVRARFAIGGAIPGFELYEQAVAKEPAGDIPDPELGTQMLYTSGTTGKPKGVYRRAGGSTRGNGATARAIGSVLSYQAGKDAHLCTGPLYHAAPLAFSLLGPLSAGAHVVMMDGWDSEAALQLIERHGVTHTHMVPTMFHRWLSLPDDVRDKYDLSSLRVILHGAAPCPVPVKQALMDWLGPIVYEYYAATEGFGSFVSPELWLERPGTVGRPDPGQVRILDDAGEGALPGQVGRVFLKAPEQARFEYYGDAAKTREAYHEDSAYFTLGDMGYLDEDGYLFLADRSADLIISGGVNIYPAEVDAVLLTHPAVADVATIGIPNDDWGEEVRAVVVLQPEHSPSTELVADLLEHCRSHLAHYKCPRSVDFANDLPRYDTGKIYRRAVRDRYWQGRDRKI